VTRASTAPKTGPVGRLGAAAARRPWIALSCWLLVVVAAVATALGGIGGQTLFDRLGGSVPSVHGESAAGSERLSTGSGTSITLLIHGVDPQDPSLVAGTSTLARELAGLPGTSVADPLVVPDGIRNPQVAPLVAKDGRGILITATVAGVDGKHASQHTVDEARRLMDAAARPAG
jgi:RND superfamily putative drug exporter